jgi:4a-hydroxytetrahydrobiopterin dehydratase
MGKQLKGYTEAEAVARLAELKLDKWFVENGWIRRKYRTDGWQTTLQVVNTLGFLCEAGYHHADLEVTWARVLVKLKTHSQGAITDMDFEMAKRMEETVLWRPAPGQALEGNPNQFVHDKS